jgi:hypothetical protein
LGPGRSRLLPASKSYAAPSLQCEREIFARVQARIALQELPEERYLIKERLRTEYKRISCRDSRQQLRLRMKRTSDRCYRKPMKLEMVNLIVGSMTGVQDEISWIFWKVRPPPKRKKEVRTA